MSKTSTRPFHPGGVFPTKQAAKTRCDELMKDYPAQVWVPCKHGERFSIVRKS